jgi:hypothetical protein
MHEMSRGTRDFLNFFHFYVNFKKYDCFLWAFLYDGLMWDDQYFPRNLSSCVRIDVRGTRLNKKIEAALTNVSSASYQFYPYEFND